MSNSLTIIVDSEKLSVIGEDGSLLSRTSNVLALAQNGQIVSVGKPPEESHQQRNIRTLNPFAVHNFHPKLAATMISRLMDLAMPLLAAPNHDETRKTITLDWHLQIPGYEELDPQVREAFEYYAQQVPQVKVRSLSINNHQKPIAVFQRARQAIMIGLFATVFFINWLVSKVTQSIATPEQLAKPLTFWEIILRYGVFIITIYFAGLVFILICKLTMKNIIPAPVYKDMIEDSDILPRNIWR